MDFTEDKWMRFKRDLKRDFTNVKAIEKVGQAKAAKEYEEFLDYAGRGECYVCGQGIGTFDPDNPCPHWLLRPAGVKKHHIRDVLTRDGYHRSAAYLRWHANYKALSKNINDLLDEGDPKAIFHWTCCYENLKWTFKCSPGDLLGHFGTRHNYPHYHLDMQCDGQNFLSFSNLHLPLSEEDIFWLRANADDDSLLKQSLGPHGSGMQDAMDIDPEKLLNLIRGAKENEEEKAVFRLDTFVSSEEGIPGEIVDEALRRAKQSGRTIAYHLRELGLDPIVTVSPSETIPEKVERTNPRGKKREKGSNE